MMVATLPVKHVNERRVAVSAWPLNASKLHWFNLNRLNSRTEV